MSIRSRLALLVSLPLLFGLGVLHATRPDAVTPDGGRYYGALADGKRSGQGRIEWDNGARYEGGFVDGLYAGKGVLLSAQGYRYEGQFSQGLPQGSGTLSYDDGRVYRGQFVRGRFEGKGRYETPRGEVYEGEFHHNAIVRGSYRRPDGAHYEGDLHDWKPHGKGRYTEADGTVYEGGFVLGELTGQGRMTTRNGATYEGDFRNWVYQGRGIFRYPNGNEYQGGFANGLFEGKGTLTYAVPQEDGRTQESGIWHEGQLEDKGADERMKRNVEAALYAQRPLLDQALAALQPPRPNRINMYLLAVAGDGSQEVFRREVEFVRRRFDRSFGTTGHSLALVNSRNTMTSQPMATRSSLREALKAIAARMDRERDILFLFLTSHGSKQHTFSLNQNGMDLPDLPAQELGTLLKESGIRWKVVVVSACYSGGFIPPLKDERTLIITAARADRTSFGCADDNDFTYFGRAFFKEALGDDGDFAQAFDQARQLVADWEERDLAGVQGKGEATAHSEPQIWYPAAIKAQLERWRAQPR
jgi:hypothetical protein